jgi:hypothetical protein
MMLAASAGSCIRERWLVEGIRRLGPKRFCYLEAFLGELSEIVFPNPAGPPPLRQSPLSFVLAASEAEVDRRSCFRESCQLTCSWIKT